MSYISVELELEGKGKVQKIKNNPAAYFPSDDAKARLMMIRDDFTTGDTIMKRPRREFNDLNFIERDSIDTMSWAVYQPNDGDALEGDQINGWRSQAVRPIVRNKVFSIAAHITARTLFPKIIAFDDESTEQSDAASVMSDLIEWSILATNATYADVSLKAVIAALVRPVSIVQTEYVQVYRNVKREKTADGYRMERILDEDYSGFIDESVPPEQVYIPDFYQPDIQKQSWVIRRRVRPFQTLKTLYNDCYPNFSNVRPGVQCIYNDANQEFYYAYDTELESDECEEVLYWNKSLDLYLIAVNGILLTDPDNANPREDKLYPFATFGYEYLRANGDSFYWKSLAFKTMPDEKIVNTLYPMIIDGTFLAIMPPMVNIGGEIIESDVIAPGVVTTFSSPDADLKPIAVQSDNLKAGMDALFQVEKNINDDAFNPIQQGDMPDNGGNMPAYNMSTLERNQRILMGPFLEMIGRYVKQMGRLRIGDIKQNITLPELTTIEGSADADLVYKSFILPQGKSRNKSKKIKFSLDMPDEEMDQATYLKHSYDLKKEEGDHMTLMKVNPILFRNLKYQCYVGTDVLQPMSEELESQWNLAIFDKAIQQPQMFDQQEIAKLLMEASPTTKKHPEKYLAKAQPPQPMQPNQQNPQNPISPVQPSPDMAMAGQ